MKKIFMASLVAMMAVTTANAYIASTEYTDATFVAKEGFDDLVGGTTQVTANKSAIEAINNSDVMQSGVKAATVAQVATNKTDIEGVKSDIQALGNVKQIKSDKDYQMGNKDGEWTTMTDDQIAALNSGVTDLTVTQVADLQVNKVNKNQTVANANKAMVTDGKGDVVPGLITELMISGNAVKLDNLHTEVKAVLGDGVNAMQAIEGMNSETTGAGPIVKSVTQTEGKVTVGLGYIETADINKVAVTTEKIADGAVTTGKIQDRAVGGAKIADSGVATRNIADDAIVTSKILDANVTTAKIADNAVTTAKIADANVTKAKLDASVKATLDKADNAMQETGLKALPSWTDQKCGDANVTCSLVSKNGVIAWEAVKY